MVVEVRLRRSDSLNGFGFRIRHGGDGPPTVSDVALNGPTAGLLEPGDEIVSVDSLVAGDVHIRQLLKHLRLARDEVTLVVKKNTPSHGSNSSASRGSGPGSCSRTSGTTANNTIGAKIGSSGGSEAGGLNNDRLSLRDANYRLTVLDSSGSSSGINHGLRQRHDHYHHSSRTDRERGSARGGYPLTEAESSSRVLRDRAPHDNELVPVSNTSDGVRDWRAHSDHSYRINKVSPQAHRRVGGARVKPMLQSASSATSNGFDGAPVGGPQLGSAGAVGSGGMNHHRRGGGGSGSSSGGHHPDSNQNNQINASMGTTTASASGEIDSGQPTTVNHRAELSDPAALTGAKQGLVAPSLLSSSSSSIMKKSHSTERKKVAEAFIMTGDAIIVTKSLESTGGGGGGGGVGGDEPVKTSPEDEEHSAASRVTLSKHTTATTGECTSELVSAFGSEELGAGYSDFDMSTANTISPSEDFSREEDWLEPDLSEAHLRHPALDCQAGGAATSIGGGGTRMRRSTSGHSNCSASVTASARNGSHSGAATAVLQTTRTTTVTTSSSWQRHSMDESSLSFYKEETYSEERRTISNSNNSSCDDGGLSSSAGCVGLSRPSGAAGGGGTGGGAPTTSGFHNTDLTPITTSTAAATTDTASTGGPSMASGRSSTSTSTATPPSSSMSTFDRGGDRPHRGSPTPPPPPLPTVSPPASPEDASNSMALGLPSSTTADSSLSPAPVPTPSSSSSSSASLPLAPLGLPPPALTRTSVDVPSALRLAKRLFNLEGFKKVDVSHHLSKNNDFSRCVAEEYLRHFDFAGLSLDGALRRFLDKFCLQGETQERERVLAHFSKRYLDCNPECSEHLGSQDAVHTLTCALMLLNTDLHGNGLSRRRMTAQDFAQNLSGLNDGKDFPKEMLRTLFQAIKDQPIKWATEGEPTSTPRGSDASGGLSSSAGSHGLVGSEAGLRQQQQQQQQQRDFRRGHLVRKCCVDPGGRRTPRGKRGWRPLYAKLSDLLLLLHKDEKSCDEMKSLTDSMQHTTPVHHCLATVAVDYTKRPWVFRLQTADLAEFLFQAASDEDCRAWVDTINCVAAALSAPALPAPTSNTAKFQRPTLPISHTRLKPQEQLESHYARVLCLEREVHECQASAAASTAGSPAHHHHHYHSHQPPHHQQQQHNSMYSSAAAAAAASGGHQSSGSSSSSGSGGNSTFAAASSSQSSPQSSQGGSATVSERRKDKDKDKERAERNAAKETFLQFELTRYNTYATVLANAIRQGSPIVGGKSAGMPGANAATSSGLSQHSLSNTHSGSGGGRIQPQSLSGATVNNSKGGAHGSLRD